MTRRSDGIWQEKIRLKSGKYRYFYAKTKGELMAKIRDFREELDNGALFSDISAAWYNKHYESVAYKTTESYAATIKRINERFGSKRISTITPLEVTAFIRNIESQGYARRTCQLHLDILRMIFNYAISHNEGITFNPCTGIALSKGLPVTKRDLPSEEDIAKIKAHALDDRFSLLPFLLYYTGLRIGEALALTDKDFTDNMISINKKVSWQPNAPVVENWTKTEAGMRIVPLLDPLKAVLPQWKGYLFSTDGKTPYSKTAYHKRWVKYSTAHQLTCTPHQLRHEFATICYDAQIPAKDAADILGHSEKVMNDIYIHIRASRREQNINILNAYVNNL